MNCLICLKPLAKPTAEYHPACKKRLFGSASVQLQLAQSRQDLVQGMPKKTTGFSISGVQIKAQAAILENQLQLVDHDGEFIIKPSPEEYPGVSENEHLTLTLMTKLGYPVPACGLISLSDGHKVFIIRRYDRSSAGKIHQEDAMQAMGLGNEVDASKYTAGSYLDVLKFARSHGGPAVCRDLLSRLIFSYVVGNNDHHLKNISFLPASPFGLAPAYDVLNAQIHASDSTSMALRFYPKGHLPFDEPAYFREMGIGHYSGGDFIELGRAAGLPEKAISTLIRKLCVEVEKHARRLVEASFLSGEMKVSYLKLLSERLNFLAI
ncbi:MAG: hypothetical protein CME36_03735 [unclassified Hahellaceae]|nr:hypothetical protein [Hahellaceae bacterium]|tara:strand:+ start:13526 stop:14491 length:966 start_codon:yes stop_codon:yes gene_type:complete